MAADWRSLVGSLVNPELRTHLATLMLGGSVEESLAALAPSRRKRQRDGLLQSGVVVEVDGTLRFDEAKLRGLLASASSARPTGMARWVQDERIVTFPTRQSDRNEVLAWLATASLQPGEVLTEKEFGARLAQHTDDVVTMRRYLYDAGLIERTASGSSYALASVE